MSLAERNFLSACIMVQQAIDRHDDARSLWPSVREAWEEYRFEAEASLPDPSAVNGPGPYVKDSSTSRKAAFENMPRQGTQRRQVLDAIAKAGDYGATRDELQEQTGKVDSAVDPRVLELLTGGWIMTTGKQRRTRMGSMADVLVLSEKGLREFAAMRSFVV